MPRAKETDPVGSRGRYGECRVLEASPCNRQHRRRDRAAGSHRAAVTGRRAFRSIHGLADRWPDQSALRCTGYKLEPRYGNAPTSTRHRHRQQSRPPVRAAADARSSRRPEPWYHGPDRAWVMVHQPRQPGHHDLRASDHKDIAGARRAPRSWQAADRLDGITGRATGLPPPLRGQGQTAWWTDPTKYLPDFQPAAALARHSALCGKNRAADNHPGNRGAVGHPSVKRVTAVVLAGGEGERYRSVGASAPSPPVPFAGKYRVNRLHAVELRQL